MLLDDSEGLISAEQMVDSIQLDTRVELVEGDYLNLDLEDRFDMVILPGVLHRHDLETCGKIFRLSHKHLKPQGELVAIDVFPGQEQGDLNRKVFAAGGVAAYPWWPIARPGANPTRDDYERIRSRSICAPAVGASFLGIDRCSEGSPVPLNQRTRENELSLISGRKIKCVVCSDAMQIDFQSDP